MKCLSRRCIGAATLALAFGTVHPTALLAQTASRSEPVSQLPGPIDRPRQTLAAPLSEAYPLEGAGDGVTTSGFNQSRWVEDWSRLRDPKKRKGPFDRLKFIPFDKAGDIYLTLSGEFRQRTNVTTNPDLRETEHQRQDFTRIVGGADLHIGTHFRAYGEIAHAGLSGINLGTPSGFLRNDAIVQQSFVELTAQVARVDLGVRYGRQTFADGPNLLVVPRDNNTVFLSFNGVRGWAKAAGFRVDAFDFTPTRPGNEGTDDDLNKDTRRFSGVSGGVAVPHTLFGQSKLFVDPFVWRLRNTAAVWGGRSAREVRNFYGIHTYGDIGPINLDWTVNHQGGSYNGRDISAWQLLFAQSYRVGKDRSAPRVGFHADYATGGGAYGTGKLRTALAPFGNNIYYSYQLYATPTNLIAIAPNVSFQPVAKVRMALEYQFSWRDDVRDAVYRANGTALPRTQLSDARKIAETARAQVVWTISPYLSITGRYEHLDAGPALTDAGLHSSDFFAGWVSFRF
ncbi:alginate export family protein [Sphingomonas sp. LB3N6]|uniref:alginate export family protein n=1 Tax=Sphingomonas fucosidasi TaxID=3096164 RepID=UPI002FC791FB